MLHPPSDMSDSLDPSNQLDSETYMQLNDLLGDYFASRIAIDAAWAREIVGTPKP